MSKVLERRWREDQYKKHIERLKAVNRQVDNTTPERYAHAKVVSVNRNKRQVWRYRNIDAENRKLLSKLTKIMQAEPASVDCHNNRYHSKSLNIGRRIAVQENIAKQNVLIADRLEHIRPTLDIMSWERDHHEREKILEMRARDSDHVETHPLTLRKRQKEKHGMDQMRTPRKPIDLRRLDPIKDARLVHNAILDWPRPNETVLAGLLARYDFESIEYLAHHYESFFESILEEDLRSTLGVDYDLAIGTLFLCSSDLIARRLHECMVQLQPVDYLLADITCARTPSFLKAVKSAYKKHFNSGIEDIILSNSDGPFSQFMLEILSSGVVHDPTAFPCASQARVDAKVLRRAISTKKSPDVMLFSPEGILYQLVIERPSHLDAALAEYDRAFDRDVFQDLRNAVTEDIQGAVDCIVRGAANSSLFVADSLATAINDADTTRLVEIVLTRAKEDMKPILASFKDSQGRTVDQAVRCYNGPARKFVQTLAKRRI